MKKPTTTIGPDRRKNDRRVRNLGGSPLPAPRHLRFSREDAIERLVDEDAEMLRGDEHEFIWDVLVDGFKAKPYGKQTDRALALEIADRENIGDGESVTVGKVRV